MLDVRDRPRFTGDQAVHFARQVYGLEAEAKPLPSERDQNFLLKRFGRPRWVLKIANSAEERSVLELQNEALRWIEKRDPSLNVPRIQPSTAGKDITKIRGARDVDYMVRLVTYLVGAPLAKTAPHPSRLLSEIGDFLGRLDNTLHDFTHPNAQRPLTWSIMQAREVLSRNLAFLSNSDQRSVVETYLVNFEQSTWPLLGELRSGVIHNDANDYNVLVHLDASGEQSVAGLLDLGDLIHGPLVYEVAVASAYVMQSAGDPMRAAAAVVRGYHARLPLTAQEFDVLFDLITVRLCSTVTLAAKQSAADPGRDYLTVSEEGAWRTLDKLRGVKRASASEFFRDACNASAANLDFGTTRRQSDRI